MKFVSYIVCLLCLSCVLEPGEYDRVLDNGTYTGTVTVYDGPGTEASIKARTCPNIAVSLTVGDATGSISLTDSYTNYVHVGGVVVNHTTSLNLYENNKFSAEVGWAIEESDTQLEDLMNLRVCDASPPSLVGDTSTGDRGLLQDYAMRIDRETGFPGEFGQGTARGTMIYGVRCTDGRFLPICAYFLQLSRN
jgi:hypothetical protein